MSEEIKVGSVVRAKSGGPFMTVSRIVDGFAYLDWFDEQDQLHKDSLLVEQLRFERN